MSYRDFEAPVLLMESEPTQAGPVNLRNLVESTMRELAEVVLRLTGSRSKLVFEPLPSGDPKQRCPDIALVKPHLGRSRQVPPEDGLRETIANFRKELDR